MSAEQALARAPRLIDPPKTLDLNRPNHDIAPATGMDHFAAPAAPLTKAPAQSERPSLPQRQTAGMTKAQPDDLADVKKVSQQRYEFRISWVILRPGTG